MGDTGGLKKRGKGAGANSTAATPSTDVQQAASSSAGEGGPPSPKPAAKVVAKKPSPPKSADEFLKALDKEARVRTRQWEGAWAVGTVLVTIIAFLTRMYRISDPPEVVFDEVHFGKFASYYLRGEYFFDVHPPLGKMLLALTGWFVGYDGHYLFDNIGEKYVENNVPYVSLRLWPAICGTLIVPFSFLTMKEIGLSFPGAMFGALMLIFDNALITQSRLILLDSMLLAFGTMTIYCWIRFFKQRHAPFSFTWWLWLSLTGVTLALTLGIKMVGLFTMATIGIATLNDLWRLLDIKRGLSNREFARHFAARALCLIFLPLFLYLSFFYIHFMILPYSGPGDAFMSPAFQAELKGSEVKALAVAIPYGANVTLKSREQSVYLHSHVDRYPLRYDDGRISSEGQQVTGYPHKDANNFFTIVELDPVLYPPATDIKLTEEEKKKNIRYLKSGDVVRLFHPLTNSYLLTHDVASPLTTTNMEITTISATAADHDARYNDTLWRFDVIDGEVGDKMKTRRSHFKLVSIPHRVAVFANKGVLPEWGFGQKEINGNKNLNDKGNNWYIDELEHPRIVNGTEVDSDKEPAKEAKEERRLTFLQKFIELQAAMISHNAGLTKPHPYSSTPITWPFVVRGISFWETKDGLRQIYLLGNPIVWWASIVGVLMFCTMWVLDRIFLRRGQDGFGTSLRRWWDRGVGFLFLAWLMHWFPFFLMGRMLFLHHYLPSFIFSTICTTAVVDFIGRIIMEDPQAIALGDADLAARIPYKAWMRSQGGLSYWAFLAAVLAVFGWSFFYFSPLTYGSGFPTVQDLRARKWLSTWDLQHA
ncbi:Dolichyl-phosphate-mannose-protein mannosyltransferase-domain-containing protein [Zopfochytrium polystomum]|nr:Dolichyl-phosphate-mannose-protein mannosyltransferase-domain-containing protein [Zopfochytrium polystomum]